MAFDPEDLVTLTDHGTMKIALGGSESNDLTPRRAQEGNYRPKRQTGGLEIRADQGSGSRVGQTARAPLNKPARLKPSRITLSVKAADLSISR